jgi:ABC-2 type transport system ATP-binding protein
VLRLQGLRKVYGARVAVDGLSLEVARGEVFGLLGPNGAGKTTTIRLAVGQLEPDAGEVDVGGLGSPTRAEVRRRIGVAPQELALYEDLSGAANLAFFGRLYGLSGAALQARVEALLHLAGLTDRGRDRVKTYSGGMQRRLNLAVALVHDPPLLLLDEPTAGVDAQSRNRLFDLVTELKAQGKTVVYTTHYMEEAERLCDRVAILDRGRLLALDTVPGLLRAHGATSLVRVERDGGEERVETADPLAALARVLKEPAVRGVHVERPSLESVFLKLTGRGLRD